MKKINQESNKITQEMIDSINETLCKDTSFHIIMENDPFICCKIRLRNAQFIEAYTLHPNTLWYSELENAFREKGVRISYNNTGDIFWSKGV